MKNERWILFFLVFMGAQAVYLTTLNPAFPNDDSAETVTAGVTLGIQHPPSYALASLVGRIQALLPLGGPLFRASWASSCWASLGAALLALVLLEILQGWGATLSRSLWVRWFCSVIGGMALALSPTYWQNALSAKGGIYHLSLCVQLLTLLLWVQARKKGSYGRVLPITLFLAGLSLAHHWETAVIFMPAGLLLFLWGERIDLRDWVRGLAVLVLGISPLLYLPLRAHLGPAMNIGAPGFLSTFWADLSRSYYSSQEINFVAVLWRAMLGRVSWEQIGPFLSQMSQQVAFFTDHCLNDLGWLFLVLAVAGLWRWKVEGERKLLWFLVASAFLLVASLLSFLSMPNDWIGAKFLLPLHWIVFLWASLGLSWVLDQLREKFKIATLFVILLMAGTLALNWISHRESYSQDRELLNYDYGVDLLKALPRGTVFFAEEDQDFFSLYYLQQVEHRRPDVVMIPTFLLFEPWGVEQFEKEQPELGLTASQISLPDHYARIIYATSEIVVKNRDRRPIGFSGFNGPFHQYYLNRQKDLKVRSTGLAWLLESPISHGLPALAPAQLRVRGWNKGFTPLDGALGGLRKVYGLLLNDPQS